MKFAQWAKSYVALVGLLATAGLGVTGIPLGWKLPLALIVAGAGAFAVWRFPNAPEDPPAPNWKSAGPAWEIRTDDFGVPYDDDYMF